METEERDEQAPEQNDEPSTEDLDEDPAYSGDGPAGDLKGG